MTAKIIPIDARLQETWAAFVAAQQQAQASGKIEDGIAAGRAWRRWIDLFLTDAQRTCIGGSR